MNIIAKKFIFYLTLSFSCPFVTERTKGFGGRQLRLVHGTLRLVIRREWQTPKPPIMLKRFVLYSNSLNFVMIKRTPIEGAFLFKNKQIIFMAAESRPAYSCHRRR